MLIISVFRTVKMECQVEKNEHFRHHLLFAFNRDAKAFEAHREICAVYEDEAITERTAQNWFTKFKNGNFDLKDSARSGRPIKLNEDRLNLLLQEEDSRQTTRELAEQMGFSLTVIENHLHSMDKVKKLGT